MIYIINENETSNYKIGYTDGDVMARLRALQTGNSTQLYLFGTLQGDAVKEREIHTKFFNRRIRNEWFSFSSEEIINFILSEGGELVFQKQSKEDIEKYKKSFAILTTEIENKNKQIDELKALINNPLLTSNNNKEIFYNEKVRFAARKNKACLPAVLFFVSHMDSQKTIKASIGQLCRAISCSRATIMEAISYLKEADIIVRLNPEEGNKIACYRILI